MLHREHSNSTRPATALGKYVKGFMRMIPVQEFEILKKHDPELTDMSAPAHRRWVKAEQSRMARIRKEILGA